MSEGGRITAGLQCVPEVSKRVIHEYAMMHSHSSTVLGLNAKEEIKRRDEMVRSEYEISV